MSQSRGDTGQSMEEILASIRRIIAEGEREAQAAPAQVERPDDAMAAGEAAPPAEAKPPEAAEPEILVLTEMVQDDGSVVSLQAGSGQTETAPAGPEVAPDPAAESAPSPPASADGIASGAERVETLIETVAAAALPETFVATAMAEFTATSPAVAEPDRDERPQLSPTPTPLAEEGTDVPAEGPKKPEIVSEEALAASTAALAQLAQSVTRSREPAPGQSRTVDELVREAVEPMLKQWLDANLSRIVERMVREAIDRVVRRVE